MIHLFTDFGWDGPYTGELKAVLARGLPEVAIIDLMHDAPAFNPRASAYLLGALSRQFIPGDLCLAVVDPGVGDDKRRVLLPEPLGPMMACTSPASRVRSMPLRMALPSTVAWRSSIWSSGVVISGPGCVNGCASYRRDAKSAEGAEWIEWAQVCPRNAFMNCSAFSASLR